MNQNERKESVVQKRISALVTVLLILTVLFCLFVVIQVMSKGYVNIGGYMMFRVVTGSMEPTISVGALLVTKEVDIDTVQLNDIVCFHTQEAEIWGKVVTHRVIGVLEGLDGSGKATQTELLAAALADTELIRSVLDKVQSGADTYHRVKKELSSFSDRAAEKAGAFGARVKKGLFFFKRKKKDAPIIVEAQEAVEDAADTQNADIYS